MEAHRRQDTIHTTTALYTGRRRGWSVGCGWSCLLSRGRHRDNAREVRTAWFTFAQDSLTSSPVSFARLRLIYSQNPKQWQLDNDYRTVVKRRSFDRYQLVLECFSEPGRMQKGWRLQSHLVLAVSSFSNYIATVWHLRRVSCSPGLRNDLHRKLLSLMVSIDLFAPSTLALLGLHSTRSGSRSGTSRDSSDQKVVSKHEDRHPQHFQFR